MHLPQPHRHTASPPHIHTATQTVHSGPRKLSVLMSPAREPVVLGSLSPTTSPPVLGDCLDGLDGRLTALIGSNREPALTHYKRRIFSHIYEHDRRYVEQDGGCNYWEPTRYNLKEIVEACESFGIGEYSHG
jgi:hypothetical protein